MRWRQIHCGDLLKGRPSQTKFIVLVAVAKVKMKPGVQEFIGFVTL